MSKKQIRRIAVTGNVSEYVKGAIVGMITGVLFNRTKRGYALEEDGNTTLFSFDATDKQFERVCELLLTYYSNMYEFKEVVYEHYNKAEV